MFCGCGRFRFVVRVIYGSISPFHSQFYPQKLKMADSPELLFALEIFSDLHNYYFPEKRTIS